MHAHERPASPEASEDPLVGSRALRRRHSQRLFRARRAAGAPQAEALPAPRLHLHGVGRRLHRRLAAGRHGAGGRARRHRAEGRGAARDPVSPRLQQLPDAEARALQRRHLGRRRQQPSQSDPELHDSQPVAAGRRSTCRGWRPPSSGRWCRARRRSAPLLVAAGALFVLVVAVSVANYGAPGRARPRGTKAGAAFAEQRTVYATVVVPGLLATWLVSTVDVGLGPRPGITAGATRAGPPATPADLATRRIWALGLIAGLAWRRLRHPSQAGYGSPWAALVLVASGARGRRAGHVPHGAGDARAGAHLRRAARTLWLVGLLAFPIGVLCLMLAVTAHIGLAGDAMSDETREWWGRVGGVQLLISLLLIVVGLLALVGPHIFAMLRPQWPWLGRATRSRSPTVTRRRVGAAHGGRRAGGALAADGERPWQPAARAGRQGRARRRSSSATCSSSRCSCTAPCRSSPFRSAAAYRYAVFSLCDVEARLRTAAVVARAACPRRQVRPGAGGTCRASRSRPPRGPRRRHRRVLLVMLRVRRTGVAHVVAGGPQRVLAAHVLSQPPGALLPRRLAQADAASVHRVRRRRRSAADGVGRDAHRQAASGRIRSSTRPSISWPARTWRGRSARRRRSCSRRTTAASSIATTTIRPPSRRRRQARTAEDARAAAEGARQRRGDAAGRRRGREAPQRVREDVRPRRRSAVAHDGAGDRHVGRGRVAEHGLPHARRRWRS